MVARWHCLNDGNVFAMKGWEELTGQPLVDSLGDGWCDVLHPEHRCEAYDCWMAAVALEAPYETYYRVRVAGGGWQWVYSHAEPVFSGSDCVGWRGATEPRIDRGSATAAVKGRTEGEMRGTQLCVWIATDGTKTVPTFSEAEAEAYLEMRRDKDRWRVEPWITTFTRQLSGPKHGRSPVAQ